MKNRVLIFADFRSPHALNWARSVSRAGWEVVAVSSKQLDSDDWQALERLPIIRAETPQDPISRMRATYNPTAGSRASTLGGEAGGDSSPGLKLALRKIPVLIDRLSVPVHARWLAAIVDEAKPDLIHGLRIPMEGISVARLSTRRPIVLSSWGQDFTLQAAADSWTRRNARRALSCASGLTADCRRDANLAVSHGYSGIRPLVVPGGGGIDLGIFRPAGQSEKADVRSRLGLGSDQEVITNPRGLRHFVRTNEFLRAIRLVQNSFPNIVTYCVGVAGNRTVERLVHQLNLSSSVRLTPPLSQPDLATLLSITSVACSPSTSDGTPNSVLEALACGCRVVVGDVDSVTEWITPGGNGEVVDATDPDSIAGGLLRALRHGTSQTPNAPRLISREVVGRLIGNYYTQVLSSSRQKVS